MQSPCIYIIIYARYQVYVSSILCEHRGIFIGSIVGSDCYQVLVCITTVLVCITMHYYEILYWYVAMRYYYNVRRRITISVYCDVLLL